MDSPEYTALAAAVDKVKGTEASATAALTGLGAYIAAHKTDPVKLQALADSLNAGDNPLVDAITSNPIPA
jgi:hypothetical protein